MSSRFLHAIALIGILVVTAVCAPPQSSAPAASAPRYKSDATVAIRAVGDWKTLDPHSNPTAPGYTIILAAYDRLVALDKGKVVPYLAKSWTIGPGSVTFDLRTDATCTDGTRVTADVVAKSMRRFFALGGTYVANFAQQRRRRRYGSTRGEGWRRPCDPTVRLPRRRRAGSVRRGASAR